MIARKKTRSVAVGSVTIGGDAAVSIQSMTNTDIEDTDATLEQIDRLKKAGCQIIRLAVPDEKAVIAFKKIRNQVEMPLVADIHFNYKLAIGAIEAGAHKIRINPGNIGNNDRVRAVIDAAKSARIPVRIGVNSGSLQKHLLEKHGGPSPRALLESALEYIHLVESFGFETIVVSIKASDVLSTIEACRLLAQESNVPQHIGITESGTVRSGSIRSAVGIGALLSEGIGDTLRVSLAGDPVDEIAVAMEILKSLGLRKGPVVIACPTCGRTQIDVAGLAAKVEALLINETAPVRVAVMGCVVNGPGEAKDADIGVAGGIHEGMIFVKGEQVRKVPESQLLEELGRQIKLFVKSHY